MLLQSTITIPRQRDAGRHRRGLRLPARTGYAALDIDGRSILYKVAADDLASGTMPSLAEDVCRALLGEVADDAIAAVRVARVVCDHASDFAKRIKPWPHTPLALSEEAATT